MAETRKGRGPVKKARARRTTKKAAPRKRTAATARTVSNAHKKAMAEGRTQSSIVRRYLSGLDEVQGSRRRGRRRTPEQMQQRLVNITERMKASDPLTRLKLSQEKLNLESELAASNGTSVDIEALEKDFVKVAKPFGERQGITYAAWRAVGVPALVLREAGIAR